MDRTPFQPRNRRPYGYEHNRRSPERDQHNYMPRHADERRTRLVHADDAFEGRNSFDANYDETDEDAIYFSDCVLLPPRPGIDKAFKPPSARAKGCKTIFIGGIPEPLCRIPKTLENILKEVFTTNGGEIDSMRINGRGFCHIRFKNEDSIDSAMTVSGYYMVVKQDYEPTMKFRMELDYSISDADAEEYERKVLVSKKFNMKIEDLPEIPIFSNATADTLTTDLKSSVSYSDATIILRYWLGNHLDRSTSMRFFNMLQITSMQIRQLQKESQEADDDHKAVVEEHVNKIERFNKEFEHLIQLYDTVHKQKNWDIFTKPQRKSIDGWLNNIRELVKENKKTITYYQNGIEGIGKSEKTLEKMEKAKNAQISTLQESLASMQQQTWDMVAKLQDKDAELQAKEKELKELKGKPSSLGAPPAKKIKIDTTSNEDAVMNPSTAKLICVLASYLQVFPNGATIESIETYLKEFDVEMKRVDLEVILYQLSDVFTKQVIVAEEGTVERWKYVLLREK